MFLHSYCMGKKSYLVRYLARTIGKKKKGSSHSSLLLLRSVLHCVWHDPKIHDCTQETGRDFNRNQKYDPLLVSLETCVLRGNCWLMIAIQPQIFRGNDSEHLQHVLSVSLGMPLPTGYILTHPCKIVSRPKVSRKVNLEMFEHEQFRVCMYILQ